MTSQQTLELLDQMASASISRGQDHVTLQTAIGVLREIVEKYETLLAEQVQSTNLPIQYDLNTTTITDSTIIDLTNCTVTMKLYQGTTQTNTVSGHDACTIIGTASAGVIQWIPKSGDLPISGKYKGDVKVTYGDNTVEVLYNNAVFKVRKLLG